MEDLTGGEARPQGLAPGEPDCVTQPEAALPGIGVTTLADGGQRAADIARLLAEFLAEATKSLDLAVYDVRFETDAGGLVLASLLSAVQRGVAVRLLYNVAHPGPIPVPPPPETAPDAIERLPIETRGIAGIPDLMHHKYVVRDGTAVWTGSTNWTDDSDPAGERHRDRALARDRVRLHAHVRSALGKGSGCTHGERPRPVQVDGMPVRPWFCPKHGERSRTGSRSTSARQRGACGSPPRC